MNRMTKKNETETSRAFKILLDTEFNGTWFNNHNKNNDTLFRDFIHTSGVCKLTFYHGRTWFEELTFELKVVIK